MEALGEYYASPVAADGKYEIHSTPALSGGRLYVRTRSSVYCFGVK